MSDVYPFKGDYHPWTTLGIIDETPNLTFESVNRLAVERVLGALTTDRGRDMLPIVEIGAGLGALGAIVPAEYGQHYIQTERTPHYVEMSRKRNPHMRAVAADAYRLPFTDAAAGTMLAMDVFDMLDDSDRSASEINRVLKPGGHFVHFHDRRPNIGHLVRGLRQKLGAYADDVVFMPGITDGIMTHLRGIERPVFEQATADLPAKSKKLMKMYASNAEVLDALRSENPEQVATAAALARDMPGEDTPTFETLFHQQTAHTLQRAGLEVITAGSITAEAIVGQGCLRHIYSAAQLQRHYQAPADQRNNVLTKWEDGHYSLAFRDDSIPEGQIRQIGALSTIIARRPS